MNKFLYLVKAIGLLGRIFLIIFLTLLIVAIFLTIEKFTIEKLNLFVVLFILSISAVGLFILIKSIVVKSDETDNSLEMYRAEKPGKNIESQYVLKLKRTVKIFSVIFVLGLIWIALSGFYDLGAGNIEPARYPFLFSIYTVFSDPYVITKSLFFSKTILIIFSSIVLFGYYLILSNCIKFFNSYDVVNKKFTFASISQIKAIGFGFLLVAFTLSFAIVPFNLISIATPEIFDFQEKTYNAFSLNLFGSEALAIEIQLTLGLAGETLVILAEFMRHGLGLQEETEGTI